jgi:hypothetical protein
MPFQSESQRRFLWAKHPDIAQKWVDEGAKSKGLPKHKRKKTSRRKKKRG